MASPVFIQHNERNVLWYFATLFILQRSDRRRWVPAIPSCRPSFPVHPREFSGHPLQYVPHLYRRKQASWDPRYLLPQPAYPPEQSPACVSASFSEILFSTVVCTLASAPALLTASTVSARVLVYSITAGMYCFFAISTMVRASMLMVLE